MEREHYFKLPAPSLARRLVLNEGNEDVAPLQVKVVEVLGLSYLEQIA